MEEKEKEFLNLIEGFQWKYDSELYPNDIFAFKNNELLFEINSRCLNYKKFIANYRFGIEQDLKNKIVWFSLENIWSIFEKKFDMNDEEIDSFMSCMMEKNLKLIRITPNKIDNVWLNDLNEHFKIQ